MDDSTALLWIGRAKDIAALLVAIGVAGEFLGDWLSKPIERRVEAARQLEIAHLTVASDSFREALARASVREKEASARIAEAERGAAEASAKAEQFRLDIAKANESAAQAEAQVASAREEAAKANLELERLKTPRTLRPEQQARIIAKLKRFAGQQFSLTVNPDPESISLMHVIESVLLASGWERTSSQVGDVEVDGAGIAYFSGVMVDVAPTEIEVLRPVIRAVASALMDEGIYSEPRTNVQLTGKKAKTINIGVGKKP